MYTDRSEWARIRDRVLVAGESKRHVSRTEAMGRQTLNRMLAHDELPRYHRTVARVARAMGEYLPALRKMVKESVDFLPARPPATSIFRHLQGCGFTGSYRVVLHHTRRLEHEIASERGTTPWALAQALNDHDAAVLLRRIVNDHVRVGINEAVFLRHLRTLRVPSAGRSGSSPQARWGSWLAQLERGDKSNVQFDSTQSERLLDELRHDSRLHRQRALCVLAHASGFSANQIAVFAGVSRNSVRRYLRAFDEGGCDRLFVSKQRRRIADDEELKTALFSLLHEPPALSGINRTTWRMADIRAVLAQRGISACADVVRTVIREAGFRWKSAKIVLTNHDPQYREKLAHIQDILEHLGTSERFFSIDEFGPFSVKMKAGRVLAAPGTQPTVPQWQKSKGCLILTAALELSRNQVTHFYSSAKNTKEMIRMANVLIPEHRGTTKLYLSWDAASWHMSKGLLLFVADHNGQAMQRNEPMLELAPLPASAQFLNVIESVFSGMARAIIHSSDYDSKEAAQAAIDRYFAERNQHFRENPQRAGKKIWGKERAVADFSASNNCKDPAYR